MSYSITLEYACHCRDSWDLHNPPPVDDVSHHSPEPCLPDQCQTCLAVGMCEMRAAMPKAYTSFEFSEVVPVKRVYRRMKARA